MLAAADTAAEITLSALTEVFAVSFIVPPFKSIVCAGIEITSPATMVEPPPATAGLGGLKRTNL